MNERRVFRCAEQFTRLDLDGNGRLTREELTGSFGLLCGDADVDSSLKNIFGIFSGSGDDSISMDELTSSVARMLSLAFALAPELPLFFFAEPAQLAKQAARVIMERADVNKDGSIDVSEFIAWFKRSLRAGVAAPPAANNGRAHDRPLAEALSNAVVYPRGESGGGSGGTGGGNSRGGGSGGSIGGGSVASLKNNVLAKLHNSTWILDLHDLHAVFDR